MRIILFLAIVLVLFTGSSYGGHRTLIKPKDASKLNQSKVCQRCHQRVFSEWSRSMHRSASPERDPIVKAFYNFIREKGFSSGECDKCHSPVKSLYADDVRAESPAFIEGVTCIFCHSIQGMVDNGKSGKYGSDYFNFDLIKAYTGPSIGKEMSFHNTEFLPLFKTVDLCGGCHQEGETSYSASEAKKLLCQQCHMPSKQFQKAAVTGKKREKVYRHLFEGGHSDDLLSMAAIVTGDARKENGKTVLDVTLENSAHHTLPTGFPLRSVYLKILAFNKDNQLIWSNYKEDPYKEDPKVYFSLIFDEKDQLVSHHLKDVTAIKDQRLLPRATKDFTYMVKSGDVDSFRVQVFFKLLSDEVAEELGIDKELVSEQLMFEETVYVQ